MPGLQEIHPPVRPLADAFDETLGGYTGINLYASWAATRGFATHWDDHDVFVLQVAGTKRWHLYGETRRFPLPRDAEPNVKPPRETVWSEVIRAGDVFYIPRGWWHDARTEPGDGADDAGSLHLSCSLLPATGLDLMEWLSGRLARHETFRRDLPHPTDGIGDAHYAALRELVIEELRGDLGQRFRDHLRSTWSERPRTSLGPTLEPWKSPDWGALRDPAPGRLARDHGAELRRGPGAGGQRLPLDLRRPVHGADGPPAPGRDRARRRLPGRPRPKGPLPKGAAPEGVSASFADEVARVLVMRGIAQAVPPAAASGPEG